MRLKTSQVRSQWFRSTLEKFFGRQDCGSAIHLWQFSRQLVLCSPVHWSSAPILSTALAAVVKHNAWYAYKSCVISKRIIFVCCLTVALLVVSDAGNLGRFGTGEPYLEYSEFYAKKLRHPGQVKLYIFFSQNLFWDICCNKRCFVNRRSRNTTGHRALWKNHNRSSNEQDLKTESSRTWQLSLCSTTSTAMHLFLNTTMASAQRLSNGRWDQHTVCRVMMLVFRNVQVYLWRPQRKNGVNGEDCMDKTKQ